jgi:hypothetical protein
MERQLIPVQCMQMTFKFVFLNFHAFKYFYYFIIFCCYLWERPFDLKGGGGYVFFLKKNILIPNVAEKNILILVEEKKII